MLPDVWELNAHYRGCPEQSLKFLMNQYTTDDWNTYNSSVPTKQEKTSLLYNFKDLFSVILQALQKNG